MASANVIVFLTILLALQPTTTISEILSPLLSPIFDEVCKEVECGKGTCKPSNDSPLYFACECNPGWMQTRPAHDDHLKFFPCVIPNCTLDYSCKEAPSPVQEKENRANLSLFDPCRWTDCGGGSCNKTSKFTHTCECREGYYNLLNITTFPCLRECSIGLDCLNLGITSSNKSTSSTPSMADNGKNQAKTILQGNFYLWIIFMLSWAMVMWK